MPSLRLSLVSRHRPLIKSGREIILTISNKLQPAVLYAGLMLSALLLVKFAIDFTTQSSLLLAAPFWLLVVAALAVAFSNMIAGPRLNPFPKAARILLLAAIPLAFLASSLDCTGLSAEGCSPYCTFIKTAWIPLIAVVSAAYFFTGRDWLLLVVSVMSFATLAPHCVCYNPGNGWWIEHIGASPTCYSWGFAASVICAGALHKARRAWPSLLVSGAIICGSTAFFVAHHYFHFPW
jgi:hypothetical protein